VPLTVAVVNEGLQLDVDWEPYRCSLRLDVAGRLYPEAQGDEQADMLDASIALRVGIEGDYQVRQRLTLMSAEIEWFAGGLDALLAGGEEAATFANFEQQLELTIRRPRFDIGTPWEGRGVVRQSFGATLEFWELPITEATAVALRDQVRALLARWPPRYEPFRPPPERR
jgi:hypothetical protein